MIVPGRVTHLEMAKTLSALYLGSALAHHTIVTRIAVRVSECTHTHTSYRARSHALKRACARV